MPRQENNPQAPLVNDIIRISVISRTEGNLAYTTHDYCTQFDAVDPAVALPLLLDVFRITCLPEYRQAVPDQCQILELRGQVLSSDRIATRTLVIGLNGSADGQPHPSQTSAIVRKITRLKGKHGRGRISMPAVPLGDVNSVLAPSRLTVDAQGTYNALGVKLNLTLAAGGDNWFPCVASRPVAPAVLYNRAEITVDWKVNPILSTTRSRKVGVGI